MNEKINESIQCSVTSCAHHDQSRDYCTLNAIKVGCSDSSVAKCGQTECASFDLGNHGTCCK